MPGINEWTKFIMEVWPMISKAFVPFVLGIVPGAIVAWYAAKAWYHRKVEIAEQRQKAAEEELARRGPQPAPAAAAPPAPLRIIARQKFSDQTVLLDGFDYLHCMFKNVTFLYNGTGAFAFSGSRGTEGQLALTTETERIVPLIRLLQEFQGHIPPLAFLVPGGR